MIPLLDINRLHKPIRAEIDEAVKKVLDSSSFILGTNVSALEKELAEYCDSNSAIGVASGTDALLLGLTALGIGPGDEVITTPYTFFSTVSTIVRAGAKPVFVDIRPDTFNIDVSHLKSAVTPQTKAIMPVHLFGQPADLTPITEIASKNGISIVEDGAQAIGSRYKGKRVLGLGDVGCLSFFPSKNLGGIGDGGMIFTNSAEIDQNLRKLRVHGSIKDYHHQAIGLNSRLDEIQAAVLRVKLPYLDTWSENRRQNAALYGTLFANSSVVTPVQDNDCYHVYNQYVIRIPNRDDTLKKFREKEIGCSIYYPVPLHLQECFAYLGYSPNDFPESEKAARETLALPIFSGLTEDEIRTIADVVLSMN